MRVNLFKKEEAPKREMAEPPEPPAALKTTRGQVVEEPPKLREVYVEREINLALINEKLNYLTNRIELLIQASGIEEEKN